MCILSRRSLRLILAEQAVEAPEEIDLRSIAMEMRPRTFLPVCISCERNPKRKLPSAFEKLFELGRGDNVRARLEAQRIREEEAARERNGQAEWESMEAKQLSYIQMFSRRFD